MRAEEIKTPYKKLDFSVIKKKPSKTLSSKEALKNISPIEWSKEVVNGTKKIIVK